jgi:hypothetical protein
MSIKYLYTITAVDKAARCMEIIYTAQGHQTMHIGARLPFEGEPLEQVVRMYAPVRYWEEQQLAVVAPEVGATGVLEPIPEPTPEPVVQDQIQPTVAGAQTL